MIFAFLSGDLMDTKNRIKGGLYGLLVGDALGVPYEFHQKDEIPPYDMIEMTPPEGFRRAHVGVRPGTWSDDGAQALCLLASLLSNDTLDLDDLASKMLAWYKNGYMAVGGKVFDIGIQTSNALRAYKNGTSPEKSGMLNPDGKGNGALMRVLPLVLWHRGCDEEQAEFAHRQCLPTHGNITNQVCCALYCIVARRLLNGMAFDDALSEGISVIREIYSDRPEYSEEFEYRLQPDEPDIWVGKGGGYVVDSLRSAFMIMKTASDYEQAVKAAIALGDDTDTTACITGGLAGLVYGYDGIPERWRDSLLERERADELLGELNI